jgi:Ca2+-binding RTX toxin-like protein
MLLRFPFSFSAANQPLFASLPGGVLSNIYDFLKLSDAGSERIDFAGLGFDLDYRFAAGIPIELRVSGGDYDIDYEMQVNLLYQDKVKAGNSFSIDTSTFWIDNSKIDLTGPNLNFDANFTMSANLGFGNFSVGIPYIAEYSSGDYWNFPIDKFEVDLNDPKVDFGRFGYSSINTNVSGKFLDKETSNGLDFVDILRSMSVSSTADDYLMDVNLDLDQLIALVPVLGALRTFEGDLSLPGVDISYSVLDIDAVLKVVPFIRTTFVPTSILVTAQSNYQNELHVSSLGGTALFNTPDKGKGKVDVELTYSLFGNVVIDFGVVVQGALEIDLIDKFSFKTLFGEHSLLDELQDEFSVPKKGVQLGGPIILNSLTVPVSLEAAQRSLLTVEYDEAIPAGKDSGLPRYDGDSGKITYTGSDAADLIAANSAANTIDGGEGNDTIYGFAGGDLINGGGGADTIEAGEGNDTVTGGAWRDLIYAGGGDDVLISSSGEDTVDGGAGHDRLVVDGSASTGSFQFRVVWQGDSGLEDTTTPLSNLDYLLRAYSKGRVAAISGYDRSIDFKGIEEIDFIGSAYGDAIIDVGVNSKFDGGGGDDTFFSDMSALDAAVVWENDPNSTEWKSLPNGTRVRNVERLQLLTGSGDDFISDVKKNRTTHDELSFVDDQIRTGAGNDTINSGEGYDIIFAGPGNDLIISEGHDSQFDGGDGIDRLIVDFSKISANDPVAGITVGFGDDFDIAGLVSTNYNIDRILDERSRGGSGISYLHDSGTRVGILLHDIEAFEITGTRGSDAFVDSRYLSKYDGRAGLDSFFSDMSGIRAPVVWVNDPNGGWKRLPNGTMVRDVETLRLITGSGDDILVNLKAAAADNPSDGRNDEFRTGAGNDFIAPGLGNDDVDGGSGVDAVYFRGARDDYRFTVGRYGEMTVSGADGTDRLRNVEVMIFDGEVVSNLHVGVIGQGYEEAYYLAANADVAAAVREGWFADGYTHYQRHGMAEGRAASASDYFDAVFYLQTNPDVAAALANGALSSARSHYEQLGRYEGRLASLYFDPQIYYKFNPDVAAAGVDAWTHYLNYGWTEGRSGSAFFDAVKYLEHNPDVAQAGVNPLLHFLSYGYSEYRDAFARTDYFLG